MRNAMVDHGVASPRAELHRRCVAALAGVNLDADVLRRYPHELSGGMKQRVCIAIGMLLGPKVIIADEPTSALDVISQRQVMETLGREQQRSNAALVLIGHDIGLMAQFVHRLAVMYAGRLVEIGTIREVLTAPAPSLHARADRQRAAAAPTAACSAAFPASRRRCASCRQAARSTRAAPRASSAACTTSPLLDGDPGGHRAACHLAGDAA